MKMTDEARQAQREYLREWRKKNPEKVKAYEASYWERKAEKAKAENGDDKETK